MNKKLAATLVTLLCAVALGIIFQAPFRWTAKKIHRHLFPEQIPETPVYDVTATAPANLAVFVRDAQRAWPKAGVSTVHAAALEVATGLLLRSDIEVGSMVDGVFVSWRMSPWKASEKIRSEVGGMAGYLSDESRYVFRRKSA